jgi:hypothetical protein
MNFRGGIRLCKEPNQVVFGHSFDSKADGDSRRQEAYAGENGKGAMMSDERLARIEADIAVLKAGQDTIKAMLSQFLPMLVKLSEDMAEIKGRAIGAPSARDFGELSGRVEEISRRQSVTLAYQPPEPRRTGGGG